MQRNEGPAYTGRPVASIPPEVSWIAADPSTGAGRSANSALGFDPVAGEQCSRTAADTSTGKLSRSAVIQ